MKSTVKVVIVRPSVDSLSIHGHGLHLDDVVLVLVELLPLAAGNLILHLVVDDAVDLIVKRVLDLGLDAEVMVSYLKDNGTLLISVCVEE